MMNTEPDTRNVVDKYRHQPVEDIVADLDTSRSELEIAVENLERDFNMGTIIRNANAFNVNRVHIIGSKQWNKRGAMKTDAYLHIEYHKTVDDFIAYAHGAQKEVIAIDIVNGATALGETILPENAILVFGAEGPGLSDELLERASKVVMIEQFGSTRSVNVGVASGIAMYAWIQKHRLTHHI
jgi:tRNA G18 (ribose-2'-O)-methylase SpoU